MAGQARSQGPVGRARRQRCLVRWVSVGVVVVMAGLTLWGLLISRPASSPVGNGGEPLPDFYGRAGQPAPDFTLRDVSDQAVSLGDFRGKRVLVNFWYAACPGCVEEMAAFEQFYVEEGGRDVVILGVNMVDDVATVLRFMGQLGITYPVVLDREQRVLDLYGVTSTPSSFLIDARGVIRGSVSGPLNREQVRVYLGALR